MKVTVNTRGGNAVSVKGSPKSVVRTVGIQADVTPANKLENLEGVDISQASENDLLVWDEATQKFVAKELPSITGGTF